MRSNYWSNSKFAMWIRKVEKPTAETSEGWKQWETQAKAKHPIRYWIVEEGLDLLQDIVYWIPDRIYDLKYYIINRWIDQSHALVAHPKHIKPGQYRDFDTRILICLFDELVDFVEIELAYSNHRWDEAKMKDLKWWQGGKWRTRTWRSAEAGLEHLNWQMNMSAEEAPVSQIDSAKEIYELYKWWTEIYPNRPEPMEVSGWSAYCDDKEKRGVGFFETDPEESKWDKDAMHDKMRKLEEQYDTEDTEMLIRLIKIRGHLWT
jgi:hypothetical protein